MLEEQMELFADQDKQELAALIDHLKSQGYNMIQIGEFLYKRRTV